MTTLYFKHRPHHLSEYLRQARTVIRVAVCWFSHRALFDILMARIKAGVRVELMVEYDTQNFREGGLDFQQFVEKGGVLYRIGQGGLMLLTQDRKCLRALGVVQSGPEPDPAGDFGGSRAVQWLWRQQAGQSYQLPWRAPAAGLAKYRGSAMQVVWEVLG